MHQMINDCVMKEFLSKRLAVIAGDFMERDELLSDKQLKGLSTRLGTVRGDRVLVFELGHTHSELNKFIPVQGIG